MQQIRDFTPADEERFKTFFFKFFSANVLRLCVRCGSYSDITFLSSAVDESSGALNSTSRRFTNVRS